MSARQLAGACAIGAYLLVLAFLAGAIASAIRSDRERAAASSRLDDAFAAPRDEADRRPSLHPAEARRAR